MDITVTMTEPEIKEAIRDYLFKHDVVSQNKEIEVNMVAGRGTNGHSAVISVKNAVTTINPTEPIPRAMDPGLNAGEPVTALPTQQAPVQEPIITKNVPMPGSTVKVPEEPVQAPGEEITAKTTEGLSDLFADGTPAAPQAEPGQTEFDENNLGEGTPTQSVDSLFQ